MEPLSTKVPTPVFVKPPAVTAELPLNVKETLLVTSMEFPATGLKVNPRSETAELPPTKAKVPPLRIKLAGMAVPWPISLG